MKRHLPTRSPLARTQRHMGRIPHGLPTAVTFTGAVGALIVGSVVGVSVVMPARGFPPLNPESADTTPEPRASTPPPGSASPPALTGVLLVLTNPAARPVLVVPAVEPGGGRASGGGQAGGTTPDQRGVGTPGGPQPTGTLPPEDPTSTPTPDPTRSPGDDDGHEPRPSPTPSPASGPTPTARPSPSSAPRPTPVPRPTERPEPTPTPSFPGATPTPVPNDD